MIRRAALLLPVALFGSMAVACMRGATSGRLNELQRAKAGDVTVVLLAKNDALKPGKDEAVLEFRKGDDQLVDVGTVKVTATMPMAGMAPMLGSTFVHPGAQPGRYSIESDLSMAGTWQLAVEWNGPAGSGKVTLPGQVR